MAKKKTGKNAAEAPAHPFRSILIGLMLIGMLVAGVTVFGNMLDTRRPPLAAGRGDFTYAEMADTVRELRQRQRDLNFNSPFAPGAYREEPEKRRI
jgi:hypothetical protein